MNTKSGRETDPSEQCSCQTDRQETALEMDRDIIKSKNEVEQILGKVAKSSIEVFFRLSYPIVSPPRVVAVAVAGPPRRRSTGTYYSLWLKNGLPCTAQPPQ